MNRADRNRRVVSRDKAQRRVASTTGVITVAALAAAGGLAYSTYTAAADQAAQKQDAAQTVNAGANTTGDSSNSGSVAVPVPSPTTSSRAGSTDSGSSNSGTSQWAPAPAAPPQVSNAKPHAQSSGS